MSQDHAIQCKDRDTFECFEKWISFSSSALGIIGSSTPVTPVGNVFQSLVALAILEVFGAHYAGSPTSIDEVIELDLARAAVLTRPGGRNRASRAWSVRNYIDLMF